MRILLVEDDERKRGHILAFLQRELAQEQVISARSYHSGVRALLEDEFDLVVLDMTIPTYDISVEEPGGRPHPFGGREILEQMERRGIPTRIVVVTQYQQFGEGGQISTLEELNAQLRDQFGERYLGAIYYDPSIGNWKKELSQIVSGWI